jgi:hypothetical protein
MTEKSRAAAPLAALVTLAIGLLVIDTLPVGVFIDGGMYVILAKALATGHGYHWLNLPGSPAATHFPPGYPALLAVIWRIFPIFPANVVAFKVANTLLLALAGGAMVVFARRRFGFSPFAAFALSIAGCVVMPVLALSGLISSEPLFLALLIPLLLFAEQVVDGERRMRDLALLGLFAGIATLVRTHGIALIGGLAVALVARSAVGGLHPPRLVSLRSRMRDALVVVVCATLVMLPWQLWVRANQGLVPVPMRGMYESYAAWLADGLKTDGVGLLWRTSLRTSGEIARMFAMLASPLASSLARLVMLLAMISLQIAGLRRSWRTAPVTTLFFVAYAGIVIAWPFEPARFIWGIWPLVLLVFALGAVEIKSWAPRRSAATVMRAALLACSLIAGVGYTLYNVREYRGDGSRRVARSQAANLQPILTWVRARTRPQDVIASAVEPAVYLYTGRLSVPVTALGVRDYFRPATVRETQIALRQIVARYHVDAIAVSIGDSLRAAVASMASGDAPELVVRDHFVNGLVFAPAAPPRVSLQQPEHP